MPTDLDGLKGLAVEQKKRIPSIIADIAELLPELKKKNIPFFYELVDQLRGAIRSMENHDRKVLKALMANDAVSLRAELADLIPRIDVGAGLLESAKRVLGK